MEQELVPAKYRPDSLIPGRVRESGFKLLETLRGLSKDPNSYGLIHGDIHTGNFMVDEHGEITLSIG
ncbi:hypothetical protein NSQ75_04640 [Paenibacillus sp. FSL L8-0463]|uniref:hypothetical protein n=1 Tax=Paenibacillus sp. FSL L8-0463 TaxID=2954687 RepID=UPI00311A90B0